MRGASVSRAAATALAALTLGAAVAQAGDRPAADGGVSAAATHQIAQLTGAGSINRTDRRWNVYGTDLGDTFLYRGLLYMVFGDTFGPRSGDWRSNTLAWIRDQKPADGLTFAGMVTDRPGHAKEILPSGHGAGGEVTVIPTNGVAVGRRMYLHYMSVHHWGAPGHWTLNRSGIAYSDDTGRTWTKDPHATWPGSSNFGQVAFVTVGEYVYLFGIPGGRFGPARLARVDKNQLLDKVGYRYWNGSGWTRNIDTASVVVPAPVGELSVRWNSYYRKWLMMYLHDGSQAAVVLRTADCLTGPWSPEKTVVTAARAPELYAPYMPPRWNSGADIYFTLSRYNYYNVFWWHTALEHEPAGNGPPRCIARTGRPHP